MAHEKFSLEYRQARVKETWGLIEHNEPDISTGLLLAMVADKTGEDQRDVIALYQGTALPEG